MHVAHKIKSRGQKKIYIFEENLSPSLFSDGINNLFIYMNKESNSLKILVGDLVPLLSYLQDSPPRRSNQGTTFSVHVHNDPLFHLCRVPMECSPLSNGLLLPFIHEMMMVMTKSSIIPLDTLIINWREKETYTTFPCRSSSSQSPLSLLMEALTLFLEKGKMVIPHRNETKVKVNKKFFLPLQEYTK